MNGFFDGVEVVANLLAFADSVNDRGESQLGRVSCGLDEILLEQDLCLHTDLGVAVHVGHP